MVVRMLKDRNMSWTARPVLCLTFVIISQCADILEQLLVLSELRENGFDWYQNSTIDALGDIFLMASLYLFAEIWCDCVEIVAASSEETNHSNIMDIRKIRIIYKVLAVLTVPWAILFALGSWTHHYDQFMLLYIAWGVLTGFSLLTPAAFMMRSIIQNLPGDVKAQPLWNQLNFMATVNLWEQLIWNALIVITIMSIVLYFHGGETSAFYIGTASIAISFCWILMHLQVVLFFTTVSKAGTSSPVFDHFMLESLLDTATGQIDFVKLSERIELSDQAQRSSAGVGTSGLVSSLMSDNENNSEDDHENFVNQV